MQKVLVLISFIYLTTISFSQISNYKFGKGLKMFNKDSTFSIKAAFRFQSLFANSWEIRNDDLAFIEGHKSEFLIRRARLKFNGFALNPKLTYKLELGLSNRDISNSDESMYKNSSNIILDAYLKWNFHKGFSILVGQTKLPGNRERVISSGDLQFVDRSLLNSKFNLDRDMGFQLLHNSKIGKQFLLNLNVSFSQGEGRNVTAPNLGGFDYTFRMEALPLGAFESRGEYVGSDLKREVKPKLAIGFTMDINDRSGRSNGNLGKFYAQEDAVLKTLYTGISDFIFKYKGFSFMGEFAIRGTQDNDPRIFTTESVRIGNYYSGSGINLQTGYLFKKNFEIALRYTKVRTQNNSVGSDEAQYFVCFSRYIVGNKLKIQTDIGYLHKTNKNDGLAWRFQIDFHL